MAASTAPVMLWDVEGVLIPRAPTDGHIVHQYDGPDPSGTHVTGVIYLNPVHGAWIAELTAAGATHAWATAWGPLAAEWIAPRLNYPAAAEWPVIDVGIHGGVMFGRTRKFGPVAKFLGSDQPVFWIDDVFGGKDPGWAEDRCARGVPTVLREITSPAGLDREDIDAALAWLTTIRATAN